MAVAFESITADGVVQIDDEHRALSLIDKRTIMITDHGNVIYGKFTVATDQPPLIAVRNTIVGQSVICAGVTPIAGGYEVCVVGNRVGNVVCFTFGNKPITESSLGLQLFNADRLLTFDALSKWIKIAKIFYPEEYYNPSGQVGQGKYVTRVDTSKTYAVAACSLRRYWSETSFWNENYWTGSGAVEIETIDVIYTPDMVALGSSNTIWWDINQYDDNYPQDDYRFDSGITGNSLFLLIDVTGY